MSRKILKSILIPGVVLMMGACAQQPQQEATPAAEPAPEPAMEAAPPADMPIELTPEKVAEIAQLVVYMTQNPDGAADMLAQHGMTNDQLDAALVRIKADATLQGMYDQAKAAAEAGTAAMPEGH